MDDLVKRLRDAYPATQDMQHTLQGDLMDEAADAIEALQARVATARRAAFEEAAKVAEHLQCATCGVWFHPSKPHTDDICSAGHSSWGGARDAKEIAAAIRALAEKG